MAEDKWSQNGISFKIASNLDFEKVKSFLDHAFFPDEPIFRSLQLVQGTGFVDVSVANLILKNTLKIGLEDKTSILAIDEHGDIIGAK